jgi:hypothetical protein
MNKKKVDLDGFPVLRLDQISYIETDVLEKAQHEVAELIIKMNLEGDKSQKSFVYYLNKQLDEMEKEIAKRIAEARVLALLEGRDDGSTFEFRSRQPLIQPLSPQSTVSKESTSTIQDEQRTPIVKAKPKFEPIPLPSEIRKQTMSIPQTSQSSRSEQDVQLKSSKSDEQSSEENQPKRPKSGQPSRRSVAVVEENFGNSFIVGAIEKRKRFYPKRVPKESEIDIRDKNRESRS